MQAQNQTIRLLCDETNRSSVLDVNANATPQCWARAATQFEVGLNSGGQFLDVSNLASVTLETALYSNRDGARLMSQTVAGATLDNTVTAANWAAGTNQNALFVFTSAQMNIALPAGATSLQLWIVISAITTAGDPIVFGTGLLIVADPGTLFTANAPPANPGAYLTLDQAMALFAPISAVAAAANQTYQPQITALVGNTSAGGIPASVDAIPTLPGSAGAKAQFSRIEIYLRGGAIRSQAFILDALGTATPDGVTIITPADQAAAVAAGTFAGTQLAWFLQG